MNLIINQSYLAAHSPPTSWGIRMSSIGKLNAFVRAGICKVVDIKSSGTPTHNSQPITHNSF